jgi:hypothetical protein
MESTSHAGEPIEEPLRSPIAQAPISLILLPGGDRLESADSASAWKSYLGTLDREFEIQQVEVSQGFGPGLMAAIGRAQYPLILLATADRQFQPADLQVLLSIIDQVDLVTGCRKVPRAWWRRALAWCGNALAWVLLGLPFPESHCTAGATSWRRRWVARWLFGLRLFDPETPFRLGRREALVRILLQSRGSFALVEQLAKANHLECIMSEEAVAWNPPPQPPAESISFTKEARALFRRANFGDAGLHLPGPASPPGNRPEAPTKAESAPS